MDASYEIEIEIRLNLDGTPVAVRALSFSSPKQTIASVLSESNSVILFESGEDEPSHEIKVNDDPIEISGGGRDLAYVACRASRTVDVIRKSEFLDRIALPGEPQAIAWNGSYNST